MIGAASRSGVACSRTANTCRQRRRYTATASRMIPWWCSGFIMGIDFAYLVGWLLPALVGSGIWTALCGRRLWRSDIPSAIGAGWLIGLFVAAACARLG